MKNKVWKFIVRKYNYIIFGMREWTWRFKMITEVLNSKPYDYYYILSLQKIKLEHTLSWYEDWCDWVDTTQIIRYLKISIKLLDMLMIEQNSSGHILSEDYLEKCLKLYCRIINEKLLTWWD